MTKTMNLKCSVSHYRILRYCFQKSYESSAGREYRSNVNFMEKSGYLVIWLSGYLAIWLCGIYICIYVKREEILPN